MFSIGSRKENNLFIYGIFSTLFCLAIGGLIYGLAYRAIVLNIKASLRQVAEQGASRIGDKLDGYLDILQTLSALETIKDPSKPWAAKNNIIGSVAERKYMELKRISISDANGYSRTSDGKVLYVGDRPYFKKALAGKPNISDPIISRVDGTAVIVFAVPVYFHGKITSILYATHSTAALCQIANNIRMGKSSNSFIVNHAGETIADDRCAMIYSRDNRVIGVIKETTTKSLDALKRLMIVGKPGAEEYNDHGTSKYLGFAPIGNTGWSLGISMPKSVVFHNLNGVLWFFGILFLVMFALFGFVNLNNIALQRLLRREKFYLNSAIDTANIVILEVAQDGRLIGFNHFAEEKLDYTQKEIIGDKTIYNLAPLADSEQIALILRTWSGEKSSGDRWEFPLLKKNGDPVYMIWSVQPAAGENWSKKALTLMGVDITERVRYEHRLLESNQKLTDLYENLTSSEDLLRLQYQTLSATQEQLIKSEERYQLAQDGSNDILWDWDLAGHQIFFSSKFNAVFGYSDEDFPVPGAYLSLFHPEDHPQVKIMFEQFLASKNLFYRSEFRMRAKNGEYKWLLCRGKAVEDATGKKIRMVGSLTDITEGKQQEATIQKLAYYDSLTELPNRVMLYDRSINIIHHASVNGTKGVLLFLDIDNFKMINDSFGHTIGDKVLTAISARLRSVISECDVYRLSGDEFVAVSPEINSANDALLIAERALAAFAKPFNVQNHAFHVTGSIGAAIFPDQGENIEDLLKNADTAMYRAKELGKSRCVLFNQSMKDQILEQITMEASLRKALENREFFLVFQPQIELSTGLVIGFEALLRWKSPSHGMVSPVKFIPIAEENGLIIPIGLWVLDQSCRFAALLQQEGLDDLSVSINISTRQLLQSDFVDRVKRSVANHGIAPSRISLEITESVLMESFEINAEKLRSIASDGIGIHLDDFGTGYSSLSYLRKLPICLVKIDKSFVMDIHDGIEQPIIGAIIAMAHQLDLQVIAEGVETPEQVKYLSDGRCDAVQGFLFSRPVPEDEALRIAKKGSFMVNCQPGA